MASADKMDPWYLLKCSSCRATLRIKSEYVHMRGRCPACGMRIEPPVPKPLVISDKDEPVGLMPQDEDWPEPATLLNQNNEIASEQVTAYALQQGLSAPGGASARTEEEESGGVYSLAFDPTMPDRQGVSRSAEWDQAKAPSVKPAPVSTPVPVQPVARPAPTTAPVPEPAAPSVDTFAFKTEIDPLFGDEVKVPVPGASSTAPAKPVAPVAVPASSAPVARLATQSEVKATLPPSTDEDIPSSPILIKKKKKKQPEVELPPERPSLDTPTKETHVYALSEAEVNRIKPDAPPKTLFFDGVFTFPWEPRNIPPWIWLSLGFTVIFLLFALILHVIEAGGMFAQVGAAALGMASFMLVVFNLSYGCACWSNTITYTAAGSKAVDWATEGWRENVLFFLRIGYYFALAMMMCAPLLVFSFVGAGSYFWLLGILFVFPIFLFSGMASMTFWNFLNGDVIKRVIVKGHHYLLMYILSVLIYFISGVAVYFAVTHAWLCFVAGPVFAAAWLIYGRLLGRMALALSQQPRKKKKKKKKKEEQTQNSDADESESSAVEENPTADIGKNGNTRTLS